MNRFIPLFIIFLFSQILYAQDKSIISIDFNPYEHPVDIVQTSDGYFITGTTGNHSTDTQLFYLKTDNNYNVVYSHITSYDISAIGTKMLKTENNEVLLNGYIGYNYSAKDILLYKLDNWGEILYDYSIINDTQNYWLGFNKKNDADRYCFYGVWNDEKTIAETDADFNFLWEKSIEFYIQNSVYTDNGIVSLTFTPYASSPYSNITFLKFDFNGNQLWQTNSETISGFSGNTLLELPNKDLLFIGTSSSEEVLPHIFLYYTDSLGNEIWHKNIGEEPDVWNICNDVIIIDSNLYITGYISYEEEYIINGLLIKTDLSGNIIWTKEYPITDAHVKINKIIQKDSETLILAGSKLNKLAPYEDDIIIIEADLEGTITNTAQINTPGLDITILPNPADSFLNIRNESKIKIESISIINSSGITVMSIPYSNKIDINGLHSGIYIIYLIGENKTFSKKVIIN